MNTIVRKYGTFTGIGILSFLAGLYVGPKQVEVKEVQNIVYRDREVKSRDRDYQTRTKETVHPDGTKVKEIVREIKDKQRSDVSSESESVKVVEKITTNRPGWRLGTIYKPSISGTQGEAYAVTLERRLFSEFYAGLHVATDKTIGVSISIGF